MSRRTNRVHPAAQRAACEANEARADERAAKLAVDQSATDDHRRQAAQTARKFTSDLERALPDGCEGAFSPYAEPARAHVIGRCVSSVFPGTNALA
jgi:hypothetical protein